MKKGLPPPPKLLKKGAPPNALLKNKPGPESKTQNDTFIPLFWKSSIPIKNEGEDEFLYPLNKLLDCQNNNTEQNDRTTITTKFDIQLFKHYFSKKPHFVTNQKNTKNLENIEQKSPLCSKKQKLINLAIAGAIGPTQSRKLNYSQILQGILSIDRSIIHSQMLGVFIQVLKSVSLEEIASVFSFHGYTYPIEVDHEIPIINPLWPDCDTFILSFYNVSADIVILLEAILFILSFHDVMSSFERSLKIFENGIDSLQIGTRVFSIFRDIANEILNLKNNSKNKKIISIRSMLQIADTKSTMDPDINLLHFCCEMVFRNNHNDDVINSVYLNLKSIDSKNSNFSLLSLKSAQSIGPYRLKDSAIDILNSIVAVENILTSAGSYGLESIAIGQIQSFLKESSDEVTQMALRGFNSLSLYRSNALLLNDVDVYPPPKEPGDGKLDLFRLLYEFYEGVKKCVSSSVILKIPDREDKENIADSRRNSSLVKKSDLLPTSHTTTPLTSSVVKPQHSIVTPSPLPEKVHQSEKNNIHPIVLPVKPSNTTMHRFSIDRYKTPDETKNRRSSTYQWTNRKYSTSSFYSTHTHKSSESSIINDYKMSVTPPSCHEGESNRLLSKDDSQDSLTTPINHFENSIEISPNKEKTDNILITRTTNPPPITPNNNPPPITPHNNPPSLTPNTNPLPITPNTNPPPININSDKPPPLVDLSNDRPPLIIPNSNPIRISVAPTHKYSRGSPRMSLHRTTDRIINRQLSRVGPRVSRGSIDRPGSPSLSDLYSPVNSPKRSASPGLSLLTRLREASVARNRFNLLQRQLSMSDDDK